jgi:hypothetical protein
MIPSMNMTGKWAATTNLAAGKKASPVKYRENPTSTPLMKTAQAPHEKAVAVNKTCLSGSLKPHQKK